MPQLEVMPGLTATPARPRPPERALKPHPILQTQVQGSVPTALPIQTHPDCFTPTVTSTLVPPQLCPIHLADRGHPRRSSLWNLWPVPVRAVFPSLVLGNPKIIHIFACFLDLGGSKNMNRLGVPEDQVGKPWL